MSNQAEPILDVEALVPTQSTCEQLADAGFRENTYFRWGQPGGGATGTPHWIVDHKSEAKETLFSLLPAPMAPELKRVLPSVIECEGVRYCFEIRLSVAFYVSIESTKRLAHKGGRTQAEARALLWLDLTAHVACSPKVTPTDEHVLRPF